MKNTAGKTVPTGPTVRAGGIILNTSQKRAKAKKGLCTLAPLAKCRKVGSTPTSVTKKTLDNLNLK